MKFKSAIFNFDKTVYEITKLIDVIEQDEYIKEVTNLSDQYICFKINKNANIEDIGVMSDFEEVSLTEELEGKKPIVIKFIIIDYKNKIVYFDSGIRDVKLLFKDYLKVSLESMDTEIDLNSFVNITKFSVIEYPIGQLSFNDIGAPPTSYGKINKIFNSGYKRIKHELWLLSGKNWNKQELRKLLDSETKLKRFYFEGQDDKGNSLFYDGDFSRKIEILPNIKTYSQRRDVSFQEVIQELER